jgi:AAA+ ATPase superfamily predicted ATPase
MSSTPKPSRLIDRDREWSELIRLWNTPRPELVTVLGRRRVGKSYVLGQFLEHHHGVYYQATRLTATEQLRAFCDAIGAAFRDAGLPAGVTFQSWTAVFDFLASRAGQEPMLVVLDEFPYLVEAYPALPSLLQTAWDHQFARTKIKVVLSGSYVSAMKRLADADQPLFGRRTATLPMAPFPYMDAARFLPGHTPRDQALAYGIFGGMPGYLALLDPGLTLAENVQSQIVSPMGRLHDEATHVLDAFLGDAGVHYSILNAVADGYHTWAKLTTRVGKTSASLSRPLDWLREMEILRQDFPATVRPGVATKLARYVVQDPYLRFWHRIMAPIISSGATAVRTPAALWKSSVAPMLDDYMGGVFEEMCRQYVWRSERLPFVPTRVGAWWDRSGTTDVDMVAYDTQGNVLIGECKWGAGRAEDLRQLRERGALVCQEIGEVKRVYYALFTGRARQDAALDRPLAAEDCFRVTLEDLYRTA